MEKARHDSAFREASAASARVRPAYGTACEVEHEDRTIRVDVPSAEGGSSTGPHPAQLMRASLGASVLSSIRTEARERRLLIAELSLEITCESATERAPDRSPARPPWERVGFVVTLESAAAEHELTALVEHAVRHSPMLALLTPDVERTWGVRLVPPRT